MRRHALSHASPKEGRTHKCHTCGNTFKRADRLSRHIKIHTGHDLKNCKHCGRGFRPDYLPLHTKSCRGRFEHDSNLKYVPERAETRVLKAWCLSVAQQVDSRPQSEYSKLVKPVRFVNESASSIWNVDREVRRAWRTDSIRSVNGAIRSASDVLSEAECLVYNDNLIGLQDLISSLEPQWAKVTTLLQLSIEAMGEHDDSDWEYGGAWGMSLLEHATNSGAFEVLRYLMSPWSNLKDAPRGRTLLHRAVQRGYLEIMTFLVRDKNADLDFLLKSDIVDLSPLAVSIESGNIDIVKHLFDLGCNLQANCDSLSTPAFSYALDEGNQDISQWLLDQRASVTKADISGRMPLHYAAKTGAVDIMRALLRSGVEIDAGDKPYLETPLCYAARYSHLDAMRLLLESGAKVEGISEHGRGTPLYAACSAVRRFGSSAFDLLVAWRVDLDRMYKDRGQMRTVLGFLCQDLSASPDGIKRLLNAGADINLGDQPPLLAAWQYGPGEIVELLLRSGAEYESLHLEEAPVEDLSWKPPTRDKKLLILQAWKEERARAGCFSG
ncbi:hypothetical protein CKM354_000620500 [Cercospora kikuchii]|uniref:C2H2-type domain-containing protein n=1 Tax=Cercospora kikuchii TaxID=84275 RepID=A0A9P3CR71_9PEZI|nr:uncharacterized protein CKM354_000620500 [Cercospora kikuchii]GIZ42958.1 hypothetical protein CKM354_000620500 [Cercospora kikuchii]